MKNSLQVLNNEETYAEHGEDVLLPSEEQLQAAVKVVKSEERRWS